ncbi:MAG: phage tail tape measure protein [Actinomycetota bacterium]
MPTKKSSSILVRILGDAEGLQKSIGVATGAIAGFGAAAAVALGKGFSDALGTEANDDLIAARLGIDPETAQRLGDVAARSYRDAWGGSLEEVTDTVTALHTSFEGLTDANLEALTGQAEALGQAFELDVGQGIQTASELMSAGLVGSADEAFDLLTRGLQEMPQGIRDELLAASNEYGDFFADLGFTGEEAFAALTEFADDGVYGIDKFGDALKELTIRGTDMSTASVEAYEAAGLSAEEMSKAFLDGGDVARDALDQTVEALLSIQDPVEQSNAAIALFGTPLEDLSTSEIPSFLESLTSMGDGLGDVQGAAGRMADQLAGNSRTKIETFKRQALGQLADFAERTLIPQFERFIGFVERNMPAAIDAFETRVLPVVRNIADVSTEMFGQISEWVEENWPQIQTTITTAVETVESVVSTVLEAVAVAWDTWGDNIVTFTQRAVGPVIRVVQGLVSFFEGVIDFLVGTFTGDWSRAWDGIAGIFGGAWSAIVGTVELAWSGLRLAVTSIIDGVKILWNWSFLSDWAGTAIDAVVGFFEALPETLGGFVESVFSAGADIGSAVIDGIAAGISGAVGFVSDIASGLGNAIIGVINRNVIGAMNDSIPNSIGTGFFSIDLPDNPIPRLPTFHDGGFVGGYGGPARDFPIMAQTGEYVMSRDQVDEFMRRGGGDTKIYVTNPMPTYRDVEAAAALGQRLSAL